MTKSSATSSWRLRKTGKRETVSRAPSPRHSPTKPPRSRRSANLTSLLLTRKNRDLDQASGECVCPIQCHRPQTNLSSWKDCSTPKTTNASINTCGALRLRKSGRPSWPTCATNTAGHDNKRYKRFAKAFPETAVDHQTLRRMCSSSLRMQPWTTFESKCSFSRCQRNSLFTSLLVSKI